MARAANVVPWVPEQGVVMCPSWTGAEHNEALFPSQGGGGQKEVTSRKQKAAQGYPLSQDSHHVDGVPYIPKDESASTCKPQRQRANEKQLFPVPLPFASLLPLNGWNNCGHKVALA